MRPIESLMSQARSLGIKLWTEDGRLRFRAPSGGLPKALRAELSERKAEIIAFLERAASAVGTALAPIPRAPRDQPLPLSSAQQRLWFLDQLEPGSSAYNIPIALRLEGILEVPILERVLSELVRRHEVLRTRFVARGGLAQQVIDPPGDWTLAQVDLGSLPEDTRLPRAQALITEEAQRPFDLEAGPVIRSCLLRLGPESHVLAVTLHHIVSDGWSTGVMVQEVAALYAAFRNRESSPLASLPLQYGDFAHWQRQQLHGSKLEGLLTFWKGRLAEPPLLNLPTDRPRPPVLSHRGARYPISLPGTLLEALNALSLAQGTTLFMTLFAAFHTLLSRHSGQHDLCIGTPVAGRIRPELEPLIGFFVNTLVLRLRSDDDPQFTELLARAREVTLEAYAHQALPFEHLVEALGVPRDPGRSPLFQAMLVLQNAPMASAFLPGLTLRPMGSEATNAKFDLTLELAESEAGLGGFLEYNCDLFEEETIAGLLESFQQLLEAVVADPTRQLSALEVLTPVVRRRLEAWQRPALEIPPSSCFHTLFERQVRLRPEGAAVLWDGTSLSYEQLNLKANRLAWHLLSLGIEPDRPVGVCLERSPDLVVCFLAILKAGAAYLPLDPELPEERLHFMLRDSGAVLVLTQCELAGRLSSQAIPVVCLDARTELPSSVLSLPSQGATGGGVDGRADPGSFEARRVASSGKSSASVDGEADPGSFETSWENPVLPISLDQLAYVIYTSGSTGRPKGVLVPHRGLAHLSRAHGDSFELEPGTRLLQFASSSFDASIWELCLALSSGVTLVFPSKEVTTDPSALATFLEENHIRIGLLPPTMLSRLSPGTSALQTLLSGGEACTAQIAQDWSPGRRLINAYGPTEATVYATLHPCDPGVSGPPPLGRPVANTWVYLLDAHACPVPVGAPGELCIAGDGLARGYAGRPGLTAAHFVPDPFRGQSGGRMYRTGDLARYLKDGTIEYLGRMDHQIKLRGFRIELGEIEAVLGHHPEVQSCAVLLKADARGEPRLVAFVVPAGATMPRVRVLRAYLSGTLPEYMVPSAFIPLEAMPLSRSGKVDRKRLASLDGAPIGSDQAFVPPRTPTQVQLALLFAEVLQLEKVGAEDHFFERGGHSLLATQLISRVRSSFGIDLPLRALFEAPTVAELALKVEKAQRDGLGLIVPPLNRCDRTGPLPLSFAQQRLWFLEQLQPGGHAYLIPVAVRLLGRLDVAILRRVFEEVIRRHESLRTAFLEEGGEPRQVILEPMAWSLPVVDLREEEADGREAAAMARVAEDARHPFDLRRAPLLRTTVLRLGKEEHWLLLTMHHIVSDGWSTGVLIGEVAALYAAFAAGLPSPLPDLPVQYPDVAHWQRGWLKGAVLEAELVHWRERLEAASVLELRTDHLRPPVQTYRGQAISFVLPKTIWDPLAQLGRDQGATSFMVLVAAVSMLLSRHTGQADFCLGTPVAGRTLAELEPLIGFFINTLVLRTDLSGDPSFTAFLARVRETTLDAYAHQAVPFEKLVDALDIRRDLSRPPLFQVMISLQNTPVPAFDLPGLTLRPLKAPNLIAKFDLSFSFSEGLEGLGCALIFNRDLFEADTVARLGAHLERILTQIAADPTCRLSELALLLPEERRQILEEWNDTRRVFGTPMSKVLAVTGERSINPVGSVGKVLGTSPGGLPPAEEPAISVRSLPTDGFQSQSFVPIQRWFEAAAQRTPEATALVFEGQTLSYGQLERRANQLAHWLHALGVGPEIGVALCLERSFELVIALLAILKAGGVCLPLDPSYPPGRLGYMLEDSGVSLLLTEGPVGLERGKGGCAAGKGDGALEGQGAGAAVGCAAEDADGELHGEDSGSGAGQSDRRSRTDGDDSGAGAGQFERWAQVDGRRWVRLEAVWPAVKAQQTTPLEPAFSEAQLAYLMYTSGSTGRPKGAMNTHRGLVNRIRWMQEAYPLSIKDGVLHKTPISFDVSLWELLWPLSAGARVVLARPEGHREPDYLAALITEQQVTVAQFVPSMLGAFLQVPAVGACASLRRVFSGGEALTPALTRDFYARFGMASGSAQGEGSRDGAPTLHNLYGPTETAIGVSIWDLSIEALAGGVPIGRPIANTRLYILDNQTQLVPIGIPGELYIAGAGVGRGYWNRPGLTAERFLPDPFGLEPGGRMYRTGDRACFRRDGAIEYLGRIDHQVKIRGVRIELGEIETALTALPQVTRAVVTVVDGPSGRRLMAYLVAEAPLEGQAGGEDALIRSVRAGLKEELPEALIPVGFMVLEALPLTPNGKLDRNALPRPDGEGPHGVLTYVPPRTEAERVLAAIVAEVLGQPRVGIHDNFFELGGDSILSIQVVSRANRAGLHLTARQIFEFQTVAGLAEVAGTGPEVAAEQGLVSGEVILTPIQRRFFAREPVDPHHWNQSILLTVASTVQLDHLETALLAWIHQHDALRLRFERRQETSAGVSDPSEGANLDRRDPLGWYQWHADPPTVSEFGSGSNVAMIRLDSAIGTLKRLSSGGFLTHIDLTMYDDEALSSAVTREAARIQTSLDLTEGPLFRAVYFELGRGRPARLLLVAHHLVVDGVSWRILLEDLQRGLRQRMAGEAISLGPKTTSFQKFASRNKDFISMGGLATEEAFWLGQAAESVTPLPRTHEGPNLVGSSRSVHVALEEGFTELLLRDAQQAYGTEVTDLLLTALILTLSRWCASGAHRIDLEGHGREPLVADVDVSHTVGWFTSLYPVTLVLPHNGYRHSSVIERLLEGADQEDLLWMIEPVRARIRDMKGRGGTEGGAILPSILKGIKEQLRKIPNRGIGFGLLQCFAPDESVRRRLAEAAPAEVVFNYLGQFDTVLGTDSLFGPAPEPTGNPRSPRAARGHLLEITARVFSGRLGFEWTYGAEIHDEATIQSLGAWTLHYLRTLILHCATPGVFGYTPSDFPLAGLNQCELDDLIGDIEGIEALYPLSPMQEGMLFHSQLRPDAPIYFEQISVEIHSGLNLKAFHQALNAAVALHPVLRTSFRWDGLRRPLQCVHRHRDLPLEQLALEVPSGADEAGALEAFLQADRARGFALDQAPPLRWTWITLASGRSCFIWSAHHLLTDGWSFSTVLSDVFRAYHAFSGGHQPQLAPAGRYQDYITWLEAQDPARATAFWARVLAGVTEPGPLPMALRTPKAHQDTDLEHDIQARHRLLPSAATQALTAMARREHLTLNTLVQAAWALLLSRYTGVQDVVFGVTVSGRPAALSRVERTAGVFINTLPLRTRVPRAEPLGPWLQALQEGQLEAREFEFSPLVDIQAQSDLADKSSLFRTLLVFENYPVEEVVQAEETPLEVGHVQVFERTNYPMTLVVAPGPRLSTRLLFDGRQVAAESMDRLLEHLHQLLAGMPTHLEKPTAALPMLMDGELTELLDEWNDTRQAPVWDMPVHQKFEAHVRRDPEHVAAIFLLETLNYDGLNRAANRLAHHLRELGVGLESVVAVCLERSLDRVVGFLAILKAGAAYLPLDPDLPEARLEFLLEDSGAELVLTHADLQARLASIRVPHLCLDEAEAALAASPPEDPSVEVGPDHLAYVIYTSGSTGHPKGVLIPHRGLSHLSRAHGTRFSIGPEDRMLQFASSSFDASVWELCLALSSGATLVLASQAVTHSPEMLHGLLEQARITIGLLPPTMLNRLSPDTEGFRTLLSGGEACTEAIVQRWAPGRLLINAYGPTEATVYATLHPCDVAEAGPPPLGRPVGHTRIYILDTAGYPVPVGVPGELCIAGPGLARGYLGRAALTAAHFIPDAFSRQPGARLYCTGDLARHRSDGTLEYLGRIDHQVKVRGFRIELGEIEAALDEHPRVQASAVITRLEADGERGLLACVVPVGEGAFEVRSLRTHLAQRLPEYMIPGVFTSIDALPLTPSGKVDRKVLARLQVDPLGSGQAFVAPRTPTEAAVATLFAEVLGRESVGATDHFFELGGHSLLATQVVSRVRDGFSLELPLRTLFDAPTVAGLARAIEEALREATGLSIPPIVAAERMEPLPLSFAQQRLWFIDQLDPGQVAYNIPVVLRLEGPLDLEAVRAAFEALVRRHEVLRTRFPSRGGQPQQVVDPSTTWTMPQVDLTDLPALERLLEAQRLAAEDAIRPFDLATGPLLRTTLLRLDREDHVLIVLLHHIISDGWSMGILVRELVASYGAAARGLPTSLPPLELQYADFAIWQRTWLEGAVLDAQLAYWRHHLADSPILELPTDRPRPAVQSHQGASKGLVLGQGLSDAIEQLALEQGVTLFMVLHTAFCMLLHRLTGQTDICVGTPVANRNRAELEPLIGFFVNTLVLRSDLTGDPSFLTLLKRHREVILEAYAHQDLPFERLVEVLEIERDQSRSPLFQVMLVFQNTPVQPVQQSKLTVSPIPMETHSAKFDLNLTLSQLEGRIGGALEYDSALFDEATIERFLERFEILLQTIVVRPEASLSKLVALDFGERLQILFEFNLRNALIPRECVHHLFEDQVDRRAFPVAIEYDVPQSYTRQVSYAELETLANRLAHLLVAHGAKPETPVGICLPRSLDQIVTLLAILKTGAPYLPLDPQLPEERLAFMLEDAGCALVVTRRGATGTLPAKCLMLDTLQATLAAQPSTRVQVRVDPQNLAYLLYTSGSTGRPKGVAMPHEGLVNLLGWQRKQRMLDRPPRTLQFASLSFDVSFQEILSTLHTGGTLILVDEETRMDPVALCEAIHRQNIERIFVPFVVLDTLARVAQERGLRLPSLRTVVTAGEQLQITPAIAWLFQDGATLDNHYGPTEAHVVAAHPLEGPPGIWPVLPPIGQPIPNLRIYVLGPALQPLPIGVPGELMIAGLGLARGYLSRPGLTAERFLPDPFYKDPGMRMYRTGDRARWHADGTIEFLGRLDEQVKIRGHRIEPAEVSVVLEEHPGVVQGVVLALDRPGASGKQLVAYVVPRSAGLDIPTLAGDAAARSPASKRPTVAADLPASADDAAASSRVPERPTVAADRPTAAGTEPAHEAEDARRVHLEAAPTAEGLRRFLESRLAAYMVPARFVFLETLPMTANGKLDRRALPLPEDRGTPMDGFVAPRTPQEAALASFFAEVLGLERVGVQDSFFRLGGHSLLATRVISRIRAVFGVELPLRALFERPTVAGLCRQLQAAEQEGAGVEAPPLVPIPRDRSRYPLSYAQERLWFIDQLEPGNVSYHLPLFLRLTGRLDVSVLQRVFEAVVARHEVLRTRIVTEEGVGHQVIVPLEAWPLPVMSLEGMARDVQDTEVARLAQEEAKGRFLIDKVSPLRTTLLRLAPDEHVLLLTMHHIASDGWSMGVLVREVSTLYAAFLRGGPDPLPPLPVQYVDFACWQRSWLEGAVLEAQLRWWTRRLADPPVLELPTDRPRPAVRSARGANFPVYLSRALTEALLSLSERQGTTLFMTLLAAFDVWLFRHAGQADLCVGTPVANRTRAETEPLIGFFVNRLVLRSDLSGTPSFSELLHRVRETTLEAYAHQDVPFDRLVDALGIPRDRSVTPLFQVMFALQNAPMEAVPLPGLALATLPVSGGSARFDLTLNLTQSAEGLGGFLQYSTELFDKSTIERMLARFERLVAAVVADPEVAITELPMLSAEERQQSLVQWNETARPYLQATLHGLVEAQADRTPDAVAVEFEGLQLTYEALDRQANQLAHHLLEHARARVLEEGGGSQKAGTPVGAVAVCLERSLELVVAILGVLKAGGAYVPLDPAYPPERLTFVVADVAASQVITSSQWASAVDWGEAELLLFDDVQPSLRHRSSDRIELEVDPEQLAYILHTSGSTGRPKGVMISHRAVANHLQWMQEVLPLDAHDAVLQKTSVAFDASINDLFAPLVAGARVVLASPGLQGDPAALLERLRTAGITVFQAVPSLLAGLLAFSGETDLPDLRRVQAGGEPLTSALAQDLRKRWAVAVVNLYGPTEAAVDVTHWPSDGASDGSPHPSGEASDVTHWPLDEGSAGQVPIGRPVANTRLYVLGPGLEPVPVGAAGELVIGGNQLAHGYLGRPGLSAASFLPDPFCGELGARMYVTGDRVRQRADGVIVFLGRLDRQVKVRGFRIELGEVETALHGHPSLREGVVVARADGSGGLRLLAYVVWAVEPPPGLEALRTFLVKRLPDHMIPSVFIPLTALPRLPNGKIDRHALPAPDRALLALDVGTVPARTRLEAALVELWQVVLGVSPIGIRDNFFALGGHSILAVRLMAAVQKNFGKGLPLATLFQSGTIEHMAKALQEAGTKGENPCLVPLQSEGTRAPLFCVHPAGGSVFVYRDLAHHLGDDQPFYGFQARGLDSDLPPHTRIEGMAAEYVAALLEAFPQGPYDLAGWSAGGLVAFEMARQLEQAGHAVGCLLLLDTFLPRGDTPPPDHTAILASVAAMSGVPVTEVMLRPLSEEVQIRMVADLAIKADLIPVEVGLEFVRRTVKVFRAQVEAGHRYVPGRSSARAFLLRSAQSQASLQGEAEARDGEWAPHLAGPPEVRIVPGAHMTMVYEPHVATLAQVIGTVLKEAREP